MLPSGAPSVKDGLLDAPKWCSVTARNLGQYCRNFAGSAGVRPQPDDKERAGRDARAPSRPNPDATQNGLVYLGRERCIYNEGWGMPQQKPESVEIRTVGSDHKGVFILSALAALVGG